jgi:hypothetical protein
MSKNVASTLGAVFVGTTIAGLYVRLFAPHTLLMVRLIAKHRLTGIVCTQAAMYFRRYQRDEVLLKLMVSTFPDARFDSDT